MPDEVERRAIQRLIEYSHRVAQIWQPGIKWRVIFADTHAVVNGHSAAETERYFSFVREEFCGLSASFGMMSDLWAGGKLGWGRFVGAGAGVPDHEWETLPQRSQLVKAASLHARGLETVRMARLYYAVRTAENQILPDVQPGVVYATYEDPCRGIFPNLPRVHLYTWSRGRSAKPWHVLADPASTGE